jgi:hypothetical protein
LRVEHFSLHGVAYRLALRAKALSAARRRHEQRASLPDATPTDDVTWKELRSALDSELGQLPEKWRLPLVLCYLEGRTQDEAANQLAWSKSTLRRRLENAREALGRRLSRRGLGSPAALSAVLLSDCFAAAAPAPGLVASTAEHAADITVGKTAATAASAEVAALTEGMLKAMFITKLKMVISVVVLLGIVALGGGLLTQHAAVGRSGQTENAKPTGGRATPTLRRRKIRWMAIRRRQAWASGVRPFKVCECPPLQPDTTRLAIRSFKWRSAMLVSKTSP